MKKPKFRSDPLTKIRELLDENNRQKEEISRLENRILTLEARVHISNLRNEIDDI